MALKILRNGKCQRPGVCNALETLLVNERIAAEFIPKVTALCKEEGVTVHGDAAWRKYDPAAVEGKEEELYNEYLSLDISGRLVSSAEAAAAHINKYGSGHSDSIITKNPATAEYFLAAVDSETLSVIYIWQTGTLGSASWDILPLILLFVSAGSIVVMYLSKQLNLLALGDASASSLGVDPDNLRIICLVAIAFIVGAIVGCAGVIGFVGLVTPHMVRMLIGSDNRFVIPAASLLGMILMLLADMGCRAVSAYDNIPIGAALALIGAPIFLYLIIRRNSYVW